MFEILGLLGTFFINTPASWPIVLIGSLTTYIFLQTSRDFFVLISHKNNKTPSTQPVQPSLPIASYALRTPSCWSVMMLAFLLMGVILKLFIDVLARFLPKPASS